MPSKDKLKKDVEKRIKTTMVGSIAAIESCFGELFGHDKVILTEEEKELREVYRKLRSKILDLGNEQIKKSRLDIELYEVNGPYYKYTFKK